MARVFVTGGTGFIGRHLVAVLRERGDEVTCLVRRSSGAGVLEGLNVETCEGDILDGSSLGAIRRAEVVYHLAALLKAPWRKDFADSHRLGTRNVVAACAASANPPRLVLVSSMAACGASVEGRPRTEADPPAPVSRYGRAKLAAERAAAELAGEVPMTIVRPPMVFGEGDRGALPLFRLANRGWFISPALRPRRLSLIHARDLVDVLTATADRGERVRREGESGQGIYFSAYPEPLSFRELGAAIAEGLGGRPPRLVRLPGAVLWVTGLLGELAGRLRDRPNVINLDKAREGNAGSWVCDTRKAREQLQFAPAVTLVDRLRQTGSWYRENGWI